MNNLSWLIYAAEVVGNVQGLLVATAAIGGFTIPAAMFICGLAADNGDLPEGSWKKPLRYLWIPILAAVLGTLIPSSKALYMIAASEAGETVVNSPDAIEMLGDLKTIIKKRLKEELGE